MPQPPSNPAPPGKEVVLVTGCSAGGIGWHLCVQLQAQGAVVYASARRLQTMAGLKERGIRTLQLDVTDKKSISRAVDTIIKECGRIDVLVNNAGVCVRRPLADFTTEQVRSLFEANYFGVVAMNDAVLPHMMGAQSGKIFNVGSGLGYCALPCMGHYSATKYALRAYTDMQRVELAPFGIKVVYVAPGYVKTHIGDTEHDLPKNSKYNAFPLLVKHLKSTVFLGTTFEAATPADEFCNRLASAVLSPNPPRHYKDGHLWWFIWLMGMYGPLWAVDIGYRLFFGLFHPPQLLAGKKKAT